MSALQSTMATLKELADTSHEIYETFEKDSRDLEHDIVSQIGSLGRFDGQQSRIESLQNRIHGGRTRIGALSERVETVRERVEGWELADREWQEKTRKRMTVVWSTTSLLALALLLLFLGFRHSSHSAAEMNRTIAQGARTGASRVVKVSGQLVNTSRALPDLFAGKFGKSTTPEPDAKAALKGLRDELNERRPAVDSDRLRALDEL